MDVNILPLKTLALYSSAKFFWDASNKNKNLQFGEIEYGVHQEWEKKLSRCREEVEQNLNHYIKNKKLPPILEMPITEIIGSLHKSFYQLLLWKINYDPCNQIDLLQEGPLYAPNFFTFKGEFNDISWAKQFVLNPNYDIIHRFCIACAFWFEDESQMLWSEIIELHSPQITSERSLFRFFHNDMGLIGHRILMIEHQSALLFHYLHTLESHYKRGFEIAFQRNYEHAAYYFWGKISDNEKLRLSEDDIFFELMSSEIDYPRDKIICFLFSKLSENKRNEILVRSFNDDIYEVWYTLVLYPFEETLQKEIINFCTHLPSKIYPDLFRGLARRIMQFQLSSDINVFPKVWKELKFEDQFYVLKCSLECIQLLARTKSIDHLGHFIKSLTNEEKEKCLLHNFYGAGISIFDILFKQKEFDLFQQYLTFFLIEIEFYTQNHVLRKDARDILQRFLESDDYIDWYNKGNFNQNDENTLNLIDSYKERLILLEELCDKVCLDFPLAEFPPRVLDRSLTEDAEKLCGLSSEEGSDSYEKEPYSIKVTVCSSLTEKSSF